MRYLDLFAGNLERRTRTQAVAAAAVACLFVGAWIPLAGTSSAAPAHRPDAWVRVCGPTNTCLIQPWHPWIGNNVYSATGRGETVEAGAEEVNMVRFWVAFQNDGTSLDTFRVKGCSGSSGFPLTHVNLGAVRAFTPGHDLTSAFKKGTLKFSLPPSSSDKLMVLTLTFLAAARNRGARYTCPVTVRSGGSSARDTVVAKMVTI